MSPSPRSTEESGVRSRPRRAALFGSQRLFAGALRRSRPTPPIGSRTMSAGEKQQVVFQKPGLHYGYVVLSLIVLAVFSSLGLARFGYTSILPAMQDGLQLNNAQTGELQSWNLLGYLLTVVFAGLLATRFGPRAVISVSLLVTCLALALTGLVPSFRGACLGRFLAGVGGAGGNLPAMALVSAWFAPSRRGLASGTGVAGSSVGLMVTGPLVPWILSRTGPEGWRVCWYVLAAIAFGAFVFCALFLRNRPEAMGLAPLGDGEAGRAQAAPQAWSQLYRSRVLWHLAGVYFAFGFSYIIYSTFFVRYLVKEAGMEKGDAGWLWLAVGMVSVVSGFIWGSLSDRFGRRAALVGVFLVQSASFLAFGLSQALPVVYLSAALFAVTAWSIPALMAALSGDMFGARLAPAALGLMTIVFGIGQALGPYLAGRIADASGSFAPAFIVGGLVAGVLGAGGSLLLRPPAPPEPEIPLAQLMWTTVLLSDVMLGRMRTTESLTILVVHGPNLNLLGKRDPGRYGTMTLEAIDAALQKLAEELGVRLEFFQSNHEGAIIDFLQTDAARAAHGVLVNPGALIRYAYCFRQALVDLNKPVVEVHMSDIGRTGVNQKVNVLDDVRVSQVTGLKEGSYYEGLKQLVRHINENRSCAT